MCSHMQNNATKLVASKENLNFIWEEKRTSDDNFKVENVKNFSKMLYSSEKSDENSISIKYNNKRIFLTPFKVNNIEVIGAIGAYADCTIISQRLKNRLKLEKSGKEEKLNIRNEQISLKK
uniref:Uncharacterized protein n=1 Tax=Strongyloides venezuelensis TaxID=75913 RepID=A0A0K0G4G3_STRVS